MLTSTLISLPVETVQAMVDHEATHGSGGGSVQERRAGTTVLLVTVFLAMCAAFFLH